MRGITLDGRFHIEEPLRTGILFDVYEGLDLRSKARVVVKVLRAEWVDEHELLVRLKGGLERQKGVAHPNLSEVLARDALLGDALIPYVARSRASGDALTPLEGSPPWDPEDLRFVAERLAMVLAKIHSWGFAHGGVHPGNVLLSREGGERRLTLTDLGTAEIASLPPMLVKDERVRFLPPEVREAPRPPRASDDLYAWGALLFTLMTGAPPERGCDRELTRAMEERYQGFGLDVVMRAFHHDAAMRFESAEELCDKVKEEFRLVRVPREGEALPASAPHQPEIVRPRTETPLAPERPKAPPEPERNQPPKMASPPAKAAQPRKAETPSPPKPAGGQKARLEVLQRSALVGSQTYYEMLDLSGSAGEEEIKQAFRSLARRLHPDRLKGELDRKDLEAAESLFETLTAAYSVLHDPSRRMAYDLDLSQRESARGHEDQAIVVDGPRDRKTVAEEYFRDASALASRGDLWGAAQTIRQAILIDPERVEFHLELGRVLARSPKWRREAEKALRRTLELDRDCAEAHYLLGVIYREAGMEIRAGEQFKRAQALDPQNARYRVAEAKRS